MSLSRGEMAQLRGLMSKLAVAPAPKLGAKKRRRRRRRKAAGNPPQNIPGGVTRGPNASQSGNSNGEIEVSRCEMVMAAKTGADGAYLGSVLLYPTDKVLTWLHKLRSAFDRIEWISASLEWKPFVGTQTNGSIAFGVDWNSLLTEGTTVTREKVQACTPVYETPVWQGGKLNLPKKYLMTRRVYLLEAANAEDKSPGTIMVSAVGGSANVTLGEIWCRYRVRLSGTSA